MPQQSLTSSTHVPLSLYHNQFSNFSNPDVQMSTRISCGCPHPFSCGCLLSLSHGHFTYVDTTPTSCLALNHLPPSAWDITVGPGIEIHSNLIAVNLVLTPRFGEATQRELTDLHHLTNANSTTRVFPMVQAPTVVPPAPSALAASHITSNTVTCTTSGTKPPLPIHTEFKMDGSSAQMML